ncbi:hypothetical protein MKW92_041788 [Papaver armeniacum]|nr:hypothetical protein MKW92_041788 [Papaver armeniacum]
MGSSSINPLTVHSKTEFLNHRYLVKPVFLTESHRISSIIQITNPQKSFSFRLKTHLQCLSNSLQFPKLTVPIKNKCLSKTQVDFIKPFTEKMAILIFGSLLFMGKFYCKPALAGISKTNTSSEVEEMSETTDNEEMYLKILEKNPRNVEALKVILYGKMRIGKTKEAVKYVERLIETEPDEVEWKLLQALSYEMLGDLSKAKRLFEDILVDRPLYLEHFMYDSLISLLIVNVYVCGSGLAMVMHKNHEDGALFEMLSKALEVARNENRVTEERNIRILIAQMNVVKGNLEEGLRKFQDLVDDNPRDFRPYLCQGIIYSLLDKAKEAEEQFKIYQSLIPDEFPQRGFLDDVVLAAKTESHEQLKKEFEAQFSYRK